MIIVLGASKGLGKEILNCFYNNNYKVVGISRSIANINKTNIETISLDINSEETNNYFSNLKADSIEAVFFTVGIIKDEDSLHLEEKEVKHLINTNFLSITKICSIIIKNNLMKKNGLICFFSSTTVFLPRNIQLYYCSAKSSLNSFAKSLSFIVNKNKIKIRIANFILGYLSSNMGENSLKNVIKGYPIDKLSKIIFKRHKKLSGEYVFPYFWTFIRIIINIFPQKIYIQIMNLFNIK